MQVSLYKHIADLSGKTNAVIPVPAITVISGGKHAGNNLAVKVHRNQIAFSGISFSYSNESVLLVLQRKEIHLMSIFEPIKLQNNQEFVSELVRVIYITGHDIYSSE